MNINLYKLDPFVKIKTEGHNVLELPYACSVWPARAVCSDVRGGGCVRG